MSFCPPRIKPDSNTKLVLIDSATMRATKYEGLKKGDAVIISIDETTTPEGIKEVIEEFRVS